MHSTKFFFWVLTRSWSLGILRQSARRRAGGSCRADPLIAWRRSESRSHTLLWSFLIVYSPPWKSAQTSLFTDDSQSTSYTKRLRWEGKRVKIVEYSEQIFHRDFSIREVCALKRIDANWYGVPFPTYCFDIMTFNRASPCGRTWHMLSVLCLWFDSLMLPQNESIQSGPAYLS